MTTADCHPLLRVTAGGFFRPAGWTEKEPLACTLLACRVAGYEDPVADPDGPAADSCRYTFRSWIEQGFRLIERGGWGWHTTRMKDVKRVWAAMALGTVWVVEVGGLSDHEERAETVPPRSRGRRPKRSRPNRSNRRGDRRRRVRVSTRGLAEILAGLLNGELRTGRFVPEPWPGIERIPRITEADFDARE